MSLKTTIALSHLKCCIVHMHLSQDHYTPSNKTSYGTSNKTSYGKDPGSPKAVRNYLEYVLHEKLVHICLITEIWQVPRQLCCRGTCQISEH